MISLGIIAASRRLATPGGVLTLTLRASGTTTNGNFSAPIGAPSPGRTVIVAAAWYSSSNRYASNPTISGIAATIDSNAPPIRAGGVVIRAVVPTGETAVISLGAGANANSAWSVWTCDREVSVLDSDTSLSAGTASMEVTVDTSPGGAVIAVAGGTSSNNSLTLVGLDHVHFDAGGKRAVGASTATSTSLTVTASLTSASGHSSLSAVSYQ